MSSLAGSALGPCPVLTDLLGAPTAFRALAPGNWHSGPIYLLVVTDRGRLDVASM